MGLLISKIGSLLFRKKNVRILMIGLDNSGKTSILYQLKIGDLVNTTPTIGFNLETIKYKCLNISIWDIGGNSIIYENKVRQLWKHYYQNTDGIIFVIDSNDKERFEQAKEALSLLISNDELKNVPLLVLANKQDLHMAYLPNKIIEILDMGKLKENKWLVQGTSAINGKGIKEGFDWLRNELLNKKTKKKDKIDYYKYFQCEYYKKFLLN